MSETQILVRAWLV